MVKAIKKSYFWFDFAVIILQISRGLTIIGSGFDDILPIPYGIGWLCFMTLAYFIRFGTQSNYMQEKEKGIFKLFFIIYFFDILQSLFLGNSSGFVRIITLLYLYFFLKYLFALYKDGGFDISVITRPYVGLSLYNVGVVLLSAILILMGVISPTSNQLSSNSLLYDNVVNGRTEYFFPGYLSVCTLNSRVLIDFGIPMLTGLSHEPHVFCMLILPSLFLLFGKRSSMLVKIGILLSYLLVMVVATSTTAFLCFSVVIIIEEIWSMLIGKNSKFQAFVIIGIIVFVVIKGQLVSNLIVEMMVERTTAGSASSGSMDYSAATLEYVVTPDSFFGSGNLPGGVGKKVLNSQIGFVTCILDLALYTWMLIMVFRNITSKNKYKHYVGMAVLYFSIHLLKLSYAIITYPFFLFMLFVIWAVNRLPEEDFHGVFKN